MNKIILMFLLLIAPVSVLAGNHKGEATIPNKTQINEYLKCREAARAARESVGRQVYDAALKGNDNNFLYGFIIFMVDLGGGITGIYSASFRNATLYGQSDGEQYQSENITCGK
ncbi:hypothetical protein [Citrobacter amalonaticus]|uniref:hypothetical protein n=2 Tax=Citrobacter amalonaticus TaxID=35703 RepID=UPI0005C95405|nr:hypothetical protein [Citrobacter amalonaticus]